jgi:Recombinase
VIAAELLFRVLIAMNIFTFLSSRSAMNRECQHGLRFPRLIRQPGCPLEVAWGDLEHNRVTRILRNPRYAGAFFYGRTRFHRKLNGGGRVQRLLRQEWHTLILDAQPAYITWQDYEEILHRLSGKCAGRAASLKSALERARPGRVVYLFKMLRCSGLHPH